MNIIDVMEIWAFKNNKNIEDFFSIEGLDKRLDAHVLYNTIILNHGTDFPLITDSTAFKVLSDNWFIARLKDFSYILDAIYAEYNPIENYSRKETEIVSNVGTRKTNDTSVTNVKGNSSNESSSENKVSAFNDTAYSPKDYNNSSENFNSTNDTTITNNGGYSDNFDVTKDNFTHGNIGVTTSQQMVDSEIKLRKYNIYNDIAFKWAQDMTLSIF